MPESSPAAALSTSTSFAPHLPPWQVFLILACFPALYVINSLMPWSARLFGQQDRSYFVPFWCSIVLLHWLSVLLAAMFVRRAGGQLADIGFKWSALGTIVFIAVITAVGLALVALKTWPAPSNLQSWQMFYPITRGEEMFWIPLTITAGFREEFVYRGFAIRVLEGRGWRAWKAIALSVLSFNFIHGIAGFFAFPFYIAMGLIFAALFLWRKSLAVPMYAHCLFDILAILAI